MGRTLNKTIAALLIPAILMMVISTFTVATYADLSDWIDENPPAVQSGDTINISGTPSGTLTVPAGAYITISGEIENTPSGITLDIGAGAVVYWNAYFQGTTTPASSNLITLIGSGALIIESTVFNTGTGGTVNIIGAGVALTVRNNGAVLSNRSGNPVYINADNVTVNVDTGGTIKSLSNNQSAAIQVNSGISGAAINVNNGGAVISDESGYAINDGAFAGVASNNTKITINTASVIAGSACAIHSTGEGTTVTVNNGFVSNAAGNNANPAIQINAVNNVDYGGNYNVIINNGTVQSASASGYAIQTTGNVLINGGFVTANNGRAINLVGEYSTAVVNGGAVMTSGTGTAISTATTSPSTVPNTKVFVSGGTVYSAQGNAIHVTGENSEVYVNGGEVITASTSDGNAVQAGISSTNPASNANVVINGGAVSAIGGASNSHAIRTYGANSTVTMSGDGRGGQVSVFRTGVAIRSAGTVTVNGGFVFAFGTSASTAINAVTLNPPVSGGIIGVWNYAAGVRQYEQGYSPEWNALHLNHDTGTPTNLKWYYNPALGSGIDYNNGRTAGFFPLSWVTVTNDHGLIFDSATGYMYKDYDGTGSLATNTERFYLGTNTFNPSTGVWSGAPGSLTLNGFSWTTIAPFALTVTGDAIITVNGNNTFESAHAGRGTGIHTKNSEIAIAGEGTLIAKGVSYGLNLDEGILTLEGGTLIAEGTQAITPANPDYGTETGPGPDGLYYLWEYVGNSENNFKTDTGYSTNNSFVYYPTDTYVVLHALEPANLISAEQVGGVFDRADSTGIMLTFSRPVDGLTADNILITDGTGAARKGELIGSGSVWKIMLDGVDVQGIVSIEIEQHFGNYYIGENIINNVSVYKTKYYKLTVGVNNEAGGKTTEHEKGVYYYPEGVDIAVTAVPNDGYSFTGWTMNNVNFINNDNLTKMFIMPLCDVELIANFEWISTDTEESPPMTTTTTTQPTMTTTTTPSTTTTTTPPPATTTTTTPPTTTTTTTPPTTTPPITTTTATTTTITTTPPPPEIIVKPTLHKLAVIAGEGGMTSGSESGLYYTGDVIEITEEAGRGNHFTGWMVNGITLTNDSVMTIKFIMPEKDVEVAAQFEHDLTPITDDENPQSGITDGFTAVLLSGGTLIISRKQRNK